MIQKILQDLQGNSKIERQVELLFAGLSLFSL